MITKECSMLLFVLNLVFILDLAIENGFTLKILLYLNKCSMFKPTITYYSSCSTVHVNYRGLGLEIYGIL